MQSLAFLESTPSPCPGPLDEEWGQSDAMELEGDALPLPLAQRRGRQAPRQRVFVATTTTSSGDGGRASRKRGTQKESRGHPAAPPAKRARRGGRGGSGQRPSTKGRIPKQQEEEVEEVQEEAPDMSSFPLLVAGACSSMEREAGAEGGGGGSAHALGALPTPSSAPPPRRLHLRSGTGVWRGTEASCAPPPQGVSPHLDRSDSGALACFSASAVVHPDPPTREVTLAVKGGKGRGNAEGEGRAGGAARGRPLLPATPEPVSPTSNVMLTPSVRAAAAALTHFTRATSRGADRDTRGKAGGGYPPSFRDSS